MRYFSLPNSEVKVSSVGLGCMSLCLIDTDEATRVVQACLDAGVTFFETGIGYETSERKLGIGLADSRRKVVLASKSRQRSKEGILRHVQTSLLRLQTDYLDIYQCHYVNREETLDTILGKDGALAGLIEARNRGWIRHIGISGHSVNVMVSAIECFPFDTVQMPHNVINEFNLPALQRAQELGMLTIGSKPFMAGELFRYGLTPSRLIAILDQQTCPDVIIPGLSSKKHAEAIFCTPDGSVEKPTPDELFPMSNRYDFCPKCLSCPSGVPVRELIHAYDILTHYTNKSTYQAVQLSLLSRGAIINRCHDACECATRSICVVSLRERMNFVITRISQSLL